METEDTTAPPQEEEEGTSPVAEEIPASGEGENPHEDEEGSDGSDEEEFDEGFEGT
jgi:hypothetical protein